MKSIIQILKEKTAPNDANPKKKLYSAVIDISGITRDVSWYIWNEKETGVGMIHATPTLTCVQMPSPFSQNLNLWSKLGVKRCSNTFPEYIYAWVQNGRSSVSKLDARHTYYFIVIWVLFLTFLIICLQENEKVISLVIKENGILIWVHICNLP